MSIPTAELALIGISSLTSTDSAGTRSGSKVSTHLRITIAIHESNMALACARVTRGLSRPEPWHGLAVCSFAGITGEEESGWFVGTRSDCDRTRRRDFAHNSPAAHCFICLATQRPQGVRFSFPIFPGCLPDLSG